MIPCIAGNQKLRTKQRDCLLFLFGNAMHSKSYYFDKALAGMAI